MTPRRPATGGLVAPLLVACLLAPAAPAAAMALGLAPTSDFNEGGNEVRLTHNEDHELKHLLIDIQLLAAKRIAEFRERHKQYPDQGYDEIAAELENHAKWIASQRIARGSSWFPNARAYVYTAEPGTVYLGKRFFDKHGPEHGGKAMEKEAAIAKEVRLGELLAVLIHERSHAEYQSYYTKKYVCRGPRWYATFMPWEAGEPQAYTLEYKWLRALNDEPMERWKDLTGRDYDSPEQTNVLKWLTDYAIIPTVHKSRWLETAKKHLDSQLRIPKTPREITGKRIVDDMRRRQLPPVRPVDPVRIPPPPDVSGPADASWRRKQVTTWRDAQLARIQQAMEKDPARAANKRQYLALLGKPRAFTCSKCGYKGKFYWFSDRWSCPGCERCIMPRSIKRADGLTYFEYADRCKKPYLDQMQRVRRKAAELLAAGR